jgi:hypothetical protein
MVAMSAVSDDKFSTGQWSFIRQLPLIIHRTNHSFFFSKFSVSCPIQAQTEVLCGFKNSGFEESNEYRILDGYDEE